jgi:hypothetical protein
MGITFVGLGLPPGMGSTHWLPSVAGPQRAAELILTGKLACPQLACPRAPCATCYNSTVAAFTALAPLAIATRLCLAGASAALLSWLA